MAEEGKRVPAPTGMVVRDAHKLIAEVRRPGKELRKAEKEWKSACDSMKQIRKEMAAGTIQQSTGEIAIKAHSQQALAAKATIDSHQTRKDIRGAYKSQLHDLREKRGELRDSISKYSEQAGGANSAMLGNYSKNLKKDLKSTKKQISELKAGNKMRNLKLNLAFAVGAAVIGTALKAGKDKYDFSANSENATALDRQAASKQMQRQNKNSKAMMLARPNTIRKIKNFRLRKLRLKNVAGKLKTSIKGLKAAYQAEKAAKVAAKAAQLAMKKAAAAGVGVAAKGATAATGVGAIVAAVWEAIKVVAKFFKGLLTFFMTGKMSAKTKIILIIILFLLSGYVMIIGFTSMFAEVQI
ncbi:hypothetical protein [Treponema sp. R6D11]